ncbi:hypothetical protein AHAS_Ahas19G0222500 [Arachis hypogaea]
MLSEDVTSYSFTKTIWKGLVPPRVELFAWFVLVWSAWISVFGRLWAFPGLVKDHFLSWTDESRRKEDRKCDHLAHLDGAK